MKRPAPGRLLCTKSTWTNVPGRNLWKTIENHWKKQHFRCWASWGTPRPGHTIVKTIENHWENKQFLLCSKSGSGQVASLTQGHKRVSQEEPLKKHGKTNVFTWCASGNHERPAFPPRALPSQGIPYPKTIKNHWENKQFLLCSKLLICRHGAAVAGRARSGAKVPHPELAGGIIPKSLFESKQVKTTPRPPPGCGWASHRPVSSPALPHPETSENR